MAVNRIPTTARFEPELLYKLARIAKCNKRSVNAQLEFLVQECIEKYEKENGEIPVDENELYRK